MSMVKHVLHWRFEPGTVVSYTVATVVSHLDDPIPRGWYCWVYCYEGLHLFIDWMAQHCPSASCIARFNSGNPMVTVYIPCDEDATLFRLTYL